MESQVQQVLSICPNASVQAIKNDLLITDSVPETINRILDGIVELSNGSNGCPALKPCNATGHSSHGQDAIIKPSGFRTQYSSDSSDDEDLLLPSTFLATRVKSTNYRHEISNHETDRRIEGEIVDLKLPSADLRCDVAEEREIVDLKPPGADLRCDDAENRRYFGKNLENVSQTLNNIENRKHVLVEDTRILLPVSYQTEVLDLTESNSSDENEIKRPGIEISSSDESETECDGGINLKRNVCKNLIADDDRRPEPTSTSESQKIQHMQEDLNISVQEKMIEISSSDNSEDELPLWKRVQNHSTAHADDFKHSTLFSKEKVKCREKNWSEISSLHDQSDTNVLKQSLNGHISNSIFPSAANGSESLQSSVISKLGEKRQLRSPEEIQSAKKKALQRRTERERQKETQTRKRVEMKKEKQRELDHRKALRESHKALRPEECMKNMTISVDQSLLESNYGPLILQRLQDLDCKVAIIAQPIEGAILWSRKEMELNLGHDIQLENLSKKIDESEALVITGMDQFVHFVHSTTQERLGGFVEGETLDGHTRRCMQILGGKSLTYIVMGVQEYFRNSKTRHQRNFRSAVLGNDDASNKRGKKKATTDNLPDVSRVQMEEVLVDLQLQVGCNVRCCETPDAVSDFVAMFTKAVAEKPFKKQRDKATFSFHVNSEWAGGAKVAKNGSGLIKVWKQQLQQFRNVSPEMATAIITQYPSPQLLLQGYTRCSTVKEAEMLLQDILIRRGEGVLATSRRIGPELSRRVYKQMTSRDENLLL